MMNVIFKVISKRRVRLPDQQYRCHTEVDAVTVTRRVEGATIKLKIEFCDKEFYSVQFIYHLFLTKARPKIP